MPTSSSIRSSTAESPESLPTRLSRLRVLVVGLEPWGAVAAVELATLGIGAFHVLDTGPVTVDDLASVRVFTDADRGTPRGAALATAIAKIAPRCVVTSAPLIAAAGHPLDPGEGRYDLVLMCVPGDDLLVLQSAARYAANEKIPSIGACLDGLEAVIGPGVVPGKTACWNCCRLRRLALSDRPEIDRSLHASLLAERPRARARTYLAPVPALLGHTLARMTLDLLEDSAAAAIAGSILVQNLVSQETKRHAVLPMPRCPVCGGAFAALPNGAPPEGNGVNLDDAKDPEDLRRMLAGVVDARTGVVGQILVRPAESARDPEMPVTATAVLARAEKTCQHAHADEPELGAGKGTSTLLAMISAVGEAVERYSAGIFNPRTIVRASVADMKRDHVAPADLCPYAEHQYGDVNFPVARLDPATPIDWVRGFWLDTKAEVLVPALPVYMNYPTSQEAYFCEVTSSGLAAGPTLEEAALGAALELIERDAFMMSWMTRTPGRIVRPDASIDPRAREVGRQLEEMGVRVVLYALDVGLGVPTIVCVGYGDGERWPGATVSLSAHLRPRVAIAKALLEQGHVGPYLRRLVFEDKKPIPEQPEDVRTLDDHAFYYAPKERAAKLAFLGEGGSVAAADLPEPEAVGTKAVARRAAAAGLRIAVVDVTSADLAQTPFRVARAMGAGFQQIHFGHVMARLGNPRLLAMAKDGINPDPHPLA
ncbi:TOMM biosynthesis cyclodehydratase protein C [Minicystis rosea]|nr:TOMM biosynthesis cyclodehydratase protein C [Minicystis rosea]